MRLPPVTDFVLNAPPHALTPTIARRRFLQGAVGAAGAIAGAQLLGPTLAWAGTGSPQPRPVPGSLDVPGLGHFHINLPGPDNDISSITDFDGVAAVADVLGTGHGTDDPADPNGTLVFEADVRFMQGSFVARDGELHQGAFGFV
jgi:hypothetical protein